MESYSNKDLMKREQVHPLINPESTHYAMVDGVEAITRLEQMFSKDELAIWAKITAFKYRLRCGNKKQVDSQSDVKKILTFEAYYCYLSNQDQ